MSNHPGVNPSLDLLDQLRDTVRDAAAREEKLTQELRAKLATEHRRRDEAGEELAQQLTVEITAANAGLDAALHSAAAKYEHRRVRIRDAHRASKRQGTDRAARHKDRRQSELQRDQMKADRDRDAGMAAAAAAYQEFRGTLGVEMQTLAWIEAGAQAAFKSYGKFTRALATAHESVEVNATADEHQLLGQLRELLGKTTAEATRFRGFLLLKIFRSIPLWLFLAALPLGAVPVLQQFGHQEFTWTHGIAAAVALAVVSVVLHFVGASQAAAAAESLCRAIGRARRLHDACADKSDARYRAEAARVTAEHLARTQAVDDGWTETLLTTTEMTRQSPAHVDAKSVRASATNDQLYRTQAERLEQLHAAELARLRANLEARKQELAADCSAKEAGHTAEFQSRWHVLEADWKRALQPIYDSVAAMSAGVEKLFPPWTSAAWQKWVAPDAFAHIAKFGQVEVDVSALAGVMPKDARLALPGPGKFSLPLLLTYPECGSLLFETGRTGRDEIFGALNNLILRLLSVAPPGRLNFTVIDPVELGQNFAGVMHLADYEEHLINSRIWTQSSQIEAKLANLNEHMEKVIQMYLRNEYQTIVEYNEQAGNIAEKYHFLVVADFPSGFSDTAIKRLVSIAASGARCGVFTLIHWDTRAQMPPDFVPDELRASGVGVSMKGNEFILTGRPMPGVKLLLDTPPGPEQATELVHQIGRASIDSNRVQVPFSHVAPPDAEMWTLETTNELRAPIGRTGATKLQYLAIGKGTRQHTLVAGKTGSGKSTLFHVMITSLAMWSSPEQVEFYLIDFKKGVEFKCYATNRLPHARVVAIESDRDFGLSVLQRLDEELKRRGEMFRKLGVQDVAGYKRVGGTEPMPRTLLLIDEFQEFFTEEDTIAQTASVLLDRIVRQGRAFGIHVVLGSQTLGGAYTVARTTLGQMVVRIALQCNEADAYLIMDDSNPAPRLLSRPGEGIYNDMAGAKEGNSPFQVVWLPDDVRDANLAKVRAHAERSGKSYPGPIVFEGDAPADVRENAVLHGLLEAASVKRTPTTRLWLGAPNSIKGPTEAVFRRQSGNNLLLVGQRDDAILAILSTGLVALAAQHPRGTARFVVFDAGAPDSPPREFLERVARGIPHDLTLAKNNELEGVINGLAEELKRRAEDEHAADAPEIYLFIHGIQKFKKFRAEDDFSFGGGDAKPSPAAQLGSLIADGGAAGIHVIVTCDTYNNVSRFLNRKALTDFEMRVLFQMSANDSASLIDSPKAGTLGLHRALLHNEHEGYLELFRPYALPEREWVEAAAKNLARLIPKP
ncbi:MAG: ATP-binding protein [Verrucomicrobia bacterium]|nr:ATP-binding protein [Verrucomicrobiota bacterium]